MMKKNIIFISDTKHFSLETGNPVVLIITLFSHEFGLTEQLRKTPDDGTSFVVLDLSSLNLKSENNSRYVAKLIDLALERGTILFYVEANTSDGLTYKTQQCKDLLKAVIFKITPTRLPVVFGTDNTHSQNIVRNFLSQIRHLPTFSIIEGLQPSIEKTSCIVKESLKTA